MMLRGKPRLVLLLAAALSLSASRTALSVSASDSELELDPTRQADGPATPSVWDPPSASAPASASATAPVRPQPAAAERAVSANPLWAIPLATLSNTRERPIFSASRRPPPPPEAPVAVVRAPPPPPKPPRVERPQLSLVGTIIGADQSFGIFVDQSTRTALRLRVGEEFQGWRLRSVQGREVALERDQQTVVISLPEPGVEGAATSVAGPVQAENAFIDDEADPIQRRRRQR
ncbi:hypothetical protein ACQR1W_02625 [Bradyrhizobium sp. HKCCYLS1011]|uniref:hypothetical protein n=1 Tax=Bradyrhizobium sp. HKCCYLS1011 TaxID=3420733 RepID=UPI003EC08659